jgi:WD40 repeat protein
VTKVKSSPNGKKILSSASFEVVVWDITNIEESKWNPVAETYEHLLMGGIQMTSDVAMSCDGTRVFSVSTDGTCGYWSLPSRKYTRLMWGESPFKRGAIAISEDCLMFVFKRRDTPVKLYYIDSDREVNIPFNSIATCVYLTS